MQKAVYLIILICGVTSLVCAQVTQDSLNEEYGTQRSMRVGVGVYINPQLLTHREVFEKIEENTGTELIDTDLFYRTAYGYAVSNKIIISPVYLKKLPLESSRRRFVRITEYILSIIPPELLTSREEALLFEDLNIIAREIPSFYYAFTEQRNYVIDSVYEDESFMAFSLPGEQVLFQEDALTVYAGRPAAGSTVYLLDSASSIRHIPGEVLETLETGFTMRVDVSRESSGISVTDIKGRLYGIVQSIDPITKTARITRLDVYKKALNDAGISMISEDKNPEEKPRNTAPAAPPPEYYEVGATFFVITREKAKVFIGNTYYGESPVLIRDIEIGEYSLVLESSDYYFKGKIRVNPYSDSLTTIKPPLYLKEDKR